MEMKPSQKHVYTYYIHVLSYYKYVCAVYNASVHGISNQFVIMPKRERQTRIRDSIDMQQHSIFQFLLEFYIFFAGGAATVQSLTCTCCCCIFI